MEITPWECDQLVDKVRELASSLLGLPTVSSTALDAELKYLRLVFPTLKGLIDQLQSRLLVLSKSLAKLVNPKKAQAVDSLDINADYASLITEIIDDAFESIDGWLDEASGVRQASKIETKEPQQARAMKRKRLMIETDLEKVATPSNRFIHIPKVHPYEDQIKALHQDLKDPVYVDKEMIEYEQEMDKTPFEWVETPEALTRMSIDLEQADVVAIDLEHHSFHSYHGFLCLMQVSTRTTDYIVDAIALREEIGPALRPFFTSPQILKIFHGAQSDIQWLQRDFNIFIVNMFDTGMAAKALQLPSYSLAYLLANYVGVETDKKFQLADWRLRPLTAEMLRYARMDTHYLLHIFSRMRQGLWEKGGLDLVQSIFQRSSQSCLALYKPEVADPTAWRSLIDKSGAPFSDREVSLIKAICEWREQVAKDEDESPPAILPNYMILRLAQGSVSNPETILNTSKHPLRAALKHVASLQEAMSARQIARPMVAAPRPVPERTHIKFPDSENEGEEQTKDCVAGVETGEMQDDSLQDKAKAIREREIRPLELSEIVEDKKPSPLSINIVRPVFSRSTSKVTFANSSANTPSLFGLFGSERASLPTIISVDAHKVVAQNMNITRVHVAAQAILSHEHAEQTEASVVSAEDPSSSETEEEDRVTILRTGTTVNVEDLISSAAKRDDRVVSLTLGSHRRTRVDNATIREDSVNLEAESERILALSTTDPTKEHPTLRKGYSKTGTTAVNKPFRISNAPKSGNKSMTFENK